MNNKNWHAIYTRSRAEKKVEQQLTELGFEVYLPLIKTLRQWSDRKKKVELPLISCYVFVCVSAVEYYAVLNVPGVVRYITFEGKAAVIPENQITAMRLAVEHKMTLELETRLIKTGERVKVVDGPLKGAEGEYVGTARKRNFIINMSNIGFLLKVEVDGAHVVKI